MNKSENNNNNTKMFNKKIGDKINLQKTLPSTFLPYKNFFQSSSQTEVILILLAHECWWNVFGKVVQRQQNLNYAKFYCGRVLHTNTSLTLLFFIALSVNKKYEIGLHYLVDLHFLQTFRLHLYFYS